MSLELEYLRYSELPFYKHFTELKRELNNQPQQRRQRKHHQKKFIFVLPNCIAFIKPH